MNNKEYHKTKALGSSGVKLLLENPHEFLAGIKMKQTEAMKMGSAVHKLVLEYDDFDKEFAVAPDYNARTNEGKAIKEAFDSEHIGKTVLNQKDFVTAIKCKEAVDAVIAPFMKTGVAEASYFAEIDGIAVKCRPDWFNEDLGIIVDLKVVQDASPDGMMRAIASFGYYIQASFYMDIMRLNGYEINKFVFCAVEKEEPYMVGVYTLSINALEFGRSEYKRGLDIFKRIDEFVSPVYKDTKYGNIVQEIELPNYVYYKTNSAY